MKKIIFSLVAFLMTLVINAQYIEIYKNGEDKPFEVFHNTSTDKYKVVLEQIPNGSAPAIIDGDIINIPYVQLWEGGPKFATINVGATELDYSNAVGSGTSYGTAPFTKDYIGGFYAWGDTINCDPQASSNYDKSTTTMSKDVATELWGDQWRTPTLEDMNGLLDQTKCTRTIVNSESPEYGNLKGVIFQGIGDYAKYKLFFPVVGYFNTSLNNYYINSIGYYAINKATNTTSCNFLFLSITDQSINISNQTKSGCTTIRAVVNE